MKINARYRLLIADRKVDPYKVFNYMHTQSEWDNIMDPKYTFYFKKAKQVVGKIIEVTFKEYLELCALSRGKSKSFWKNEYDSINWKNVEKIKEFMLKGTRMDAPNVSFVRHGAQEGRHRCAAIAQINGENFKIPIILIESYTPKMQQEEFNLPKGWHFKDNYLLDGKNEFIAHVSEMNADDFKKRLPRIIKSYTESIS